MTQAVVITGASRGIGRAIALRCAHQGYSLALLSRDVEGNEETAKQARELGSPEVIVQACDIRHKHQIESAFAAASEGLGGLTALVANSGVGGPNKPGAEDRWDEVIDVNLNGSYHCLRAAQKHLRDGPEARHLIVISSILGRIGVPAYTAYCASKAGLLGLTRALACELASSNVQVNAICPGWVDTDMAREGLEDMAKGLKISYDQAHAMAMQAVPLGRMAKPENIAGVVAWLLSGDALGVTGQGIDINGGAFMI